MIGDALIRAIAERDVSDRQQAALIVLRREAHFNLKTVPGKQTWQERHDDLCRLILSVVDAAHSPPSEPRPHAAPDAYNWGPDGPPKGQAVAYAYGLGWLQVEEDGTWKRLGEA